MPQYLITTYELAIVNESRPASRLAHLCAGDMVWVWDGVKEQNLWCEIADIKFVDGRAKIRVEGTRFYFDEGLVISYAVNAQLHHEREVA